MPILKEISIVDISPTHLESKLQCAICLENFIINESARQLVCRHIYHDSCVMPWFQKHTTCPTCRTVVIHQDPEFTLDRDSAEEGSFTDEEMLSDEQDSLFSEDMNGSFQEAEMQFMENSDVDSNDDRNISIGSDDESNIDENSLTDSQIDEIDSSSIEHSDNFDTNSLESEIIEHSDNFDTNSLESEINEDSNSNDGDLVDEVSSSWSDEKDEMNYNDEDCSSIWYTDNEDISSVYSSSNEGYQSVEEPPGEEGNRRDEYYSDDEDSGSASIYNFSNDKNVIVIRDSVLEDFPDEEAINEGECNSENVYHGTCSSKNERKSTKAERMNTIFGQRTGTTENKNGVAAHEVVHSVDNHLPVKESVVGLDILLSERDKQDYSNLSKDNYPDSKRHIINYQIGFTDDQKPFENDNKQRYCKFNADKIDIEKDTKKHLFPKENVSNIVKQDKQLNVEPIHLSNKVRSFESNTNSDEEPNLSFQTSIDSEDHFLDNRPKVILNENSSEGGYSIEKYCFNTDKQYKKTLIDLNHYSLTDNFLTVQGRWRSDKNSVLSCSSRAGLEVLSEYSSGRSGCLNNVTKLCDYSNGEQKSNGVKCSLINTSRETVNLTHKSQNILKKYNKCCELSNHVSVPNSNLGKEIAQERESNHKSLETKHSFRRKYAEENDNASRRSAKIRCDENNLFTQESYANLPSEKNGLHFGQNCVMEKVREPDDLISKRGSIIINCKYRNQIVKSDKTSENICIGENKLYFRDIPKRNLFLIERSNLIRNSTSLTTKIITNLQIINNKSGLWKITDVRIPKSLNNGNISRVISKKRKIVQKRKQSLLRKFDVLKKIIPLKKGFLVQVPTQFLLQKLRGGSNVQINTPLQQNISTIYNKKTYIIKKGILIKKEQCAKKTILLRKVTLIKNKRLTKVSNNYTFNKKFNSFKELPLLTSIVTVEKCDSNSNSDSCFKSTGSRGTAIKRKRQKH